MVPPKEIELTNKIMDETTGGFAALGVTGILLKGVEAAGMIEPKPIQMQAIPHQLEGRDILGIAQTGSARRRLSAFPFSRRSSDLATSAARKPRVR